MPSCPDRMPMKVFITGATGFVGANLVRALLASGYQVRALVRPGADTRNIAGLRVEQVEGDLSDKQRLTSAMKGCQALFHVAAHYSLWRADANAIYRSNIEGTRNVLEAAETAGVERVVYTSSVAALGVPPPGRVANEQTQTKLEELVSDYKKSKFLAEQEALRRARAGQHIVIVNPTTPIGPYDIKPTPTGQIVLRFLNRQMPAYVNTGLNLIDVEDVARGHVLALERGKPAERYILGNRNITLKQMLDILSQITGHPSPRVRLPHLIPLVAAYIDEGLFARLGKRPSISIYSVQMSRHAMYYDSSKAVRELGLPQSQIEVALEKAVRWFRDNGYVK
jgi:dihydroflavonol-4-reductase